MSEETKQEKTQEPKAEAPAEQKAAVKVEIPKNCGSCNKPVRRIRFYRNMKFFCNKKCWEKFQKAQADEKKKKEAASQPEPQAQ